MNKTAWEEFRAAGFLWWINMLLHTFGWAIVFTYDEGGQLIEATPQRVKFRGFHREADSEGYAKIAHYMNENAPAFIKEAEAK